MNTTQTYSNSSISSEYVSFGIPASTKYVWGNIGIEKRISAHWLRKLYEDSLIHDLWTVLTSPI